MEVARDPRQARRSASPSRTRTSSRPARTIPQPFARWRDALGGCTRAVPARRLLALDPAERPRPPTSTAQRRLPARQAAVRRYGRRPGPARRSPPASRRAGGWEGFVVITGTPSGRRGRRRAARRRIGPTNRMPRTDALAAYRSSSPTSSGRRPGRRAALLERRGTSPTTRTLLAPARRACGAAQPMAVSATPSRAFSAPQAALRRPGRPELRARRGRA